MAKQQKANQQVASKSRIKIPRWWPVIASALLLQSTFHPVNLSLLVFVALAPLIAYIRDTDCPKAALKAGYLFGAVYFGFQLFWIRDFVGHYLNNPAVGFFPWGVSTFLAGFYFMAAAWLIHLCFRQKIQWAIPIVWAAIEGIRAFIPILAFPWGFVAHPLWQFPWLVQHAAFGTVIFVSAWVVLINLITAETLLRPAEPSKHAHAQTLFRYAWVVTGVFFIGATRMSILPKTTEKTITGGQPGVDMAFTTPEQEAEQLTAATPKLLLAAEIQNTDLLVLPEGFAGSVYDTVPNTPLGSTPPVPVVMGGQRFADGTSYQSAILWDGKTWSHADKTRLVVMGEYVPFRDQLPFLKNFNVALEDLSPAKTLTTPTVNGLKIGPLICFEGVFPDIAANHCLNGAQVLVQMSIDDWYEKTPAYQQLWQSSVWRSIESGLPLVRVGARGQSLYTDYRGRIKSLVPVGETTGFQAKLQVPTASDAFPYRIWFVYATWVATLGIITRQAVLFQKRRTNLSKSTNN